MIAETLFPFAQFRQLAFFGGSTIGTECLAAGPDAFGFAPPVQFDQLQTKWDSFFGLVFGEQLQTAQANPAREPLPLNTENDVPIQ